MGEEGDEGGSKLIRVYRTDSKVGKLDFPSFLSLYAESNKSLKFSSLSSKII